MAVEALNAVPGCALWSHIFICYEYDHYDMINMIMRYLIVIQRSHGQEHNIDSKHAVHLYYCAIQLVQC